jgi:hypothetical protein
MDEDLDEIPTFGPDELIGTGWLDGHPVRQYGRGFAIQIDAAWQDFPDGDSLQEILSTRE